LRVRFTAEAERSLEQIGDYIAQDNPERALSFVRELRDKCLSLANMPYGFALALGYEETGIRRRPHGDYLIFYRVDNDIVVIISVLHGTRNYTNLL